MSSFVILVNNGDYIIESDHRQQERTWKRFQVLGQHGAGIVFDTFVANMFLAQEALNDCETSPEEIGCSLRGSLSLLVLDELTGSIYLLADPLGASLVFKYSRGGVLAYASDLTSLKKGLSQRSIALRKSKEYQMSVGLIGNGGIATSSFEDTEVLSQFKYVEFHSDHVGENTYEIPGITSGNDLSLDESVERFLTDVSRNVVAVGKSTSSTKICQITGGIDSRLVLGALLKEGIAEQFRYFVGGPDDSLDVLTSRNLCGTLGLTMTRYDGVDRLVQPTGIDELVWPLHETSGILQGPASLGFASNDNIILSGGYGELLRSFYGNKTLDSLKSDWDLFLDIYGSFGVPVDGKSGIWQRQFVQSTATKMKQKLEASAELGFTSKDQLDYFYASTRNRYYVGEISRSMSKYTRRFDPLYSPALLSLMKASTLESRQTSDLQLGILRGLAPGLVELPFDTPRVSDGFRRKYDLKLVDFQLNIQPEFDDRRNTIPVRPVGVPPLTGSKQLSKQAIDINMPFHALKEAEFSRTYLLELLSSGALNEFSEYMDLTSLKVFLNSPVKWRPQIRLLRRLGANLTWFQS